MTIISIETLKNGKRVVNFREWPNESENNNYSIEHFGCSENDTDEEVLDAAEQWFIDTWGEDAEYEIEYPKNKKTESKNNVAIKGANSLYENYVRIFGETPGKKSLNEEKHELNANYVANKLSQLAHKLFDYDFKIRSERAKIKSMWNEVRDLLNNNDSDSLIDKVKYRGENNARGGKKVLKEGKRVNAQIAKQIKNIADAERKAGGTVEINSRLPYVSVNSSNGDEYFFQGHEAEDLLDEVPDNVNREDYILYVSTGW